MAAPAPAWPVAAPMAAPAAVARDCFSAVWPFWGYTWALGCAAGPEAHPESAAAKPIRAAHADTRDPAIFMSEPPWARYSRLMRFFFEYRRPDFFDPLR